MALTLGAAVLLPAAVASVTFLRILFDRPIPGPLADAFTLTVGLMILHKAESFLQREQDVCPVYLTAARAPWAGSRRDVNFVAFVGTFLGMLVAVLGFVQGGPWPLVLLSVWMVQGLHELHHGAKSVAWRRLYPGTITSLLFVAAVDFVYLPAWLRALHLPARFGWGFLAVQPLVWAAFFVEHRRWLARVATVGGYGVLQGVDPEREAA